LAGDALDLPSSAGERDWVKPGGNAEELIATASGALQAEGRKALKPVYRRGLKPEGSRQVGFMTWLDAQHESLARSAAQGTP
jgi:hypothetical protein